MKVDFIIVGQGLAGTLLGSSLEDMGKSFVVIDSLNKYASSRQAAGIINPITGRRYVKSWNFDLLEKTFIPFYQNIEQKLREKFLFDHKITLCLASIKEENDLLSQALRYDYNDKLERTTAPVSINEKNRLAFYNLQGYKLEVQRLCNAFSKKWLSENKIQQETFEYEKVNFGDKKLSYKSIEASTIVFCEGAFVSKNPFFNHLGVIPNKGQFLIAKNRIGLKDSSIKDKIIISSHLDDLWIGATYEWAFDDPTPDEKGLTEIMNYLRDLYTSPIEIKAHLSGLRPTTKDRRPIMSRHEKYPNLWCINGFGTKGASLGPYMIQRFLHDFN